MLAGKHVAVMDILSKTLVELIEEGPGRTETELAWVIGDSLDHVSAECQRLFNQGRVRRRGVGSRFDPFTYYPI